MIDSRNGVKRDCAWQVPSTTDVMGALCQCFEGPGVRCRKKSAGDVRIRTFALPGTEQTSNRAELLAAFTVKQGSRR